MNRYQIPILVLPLIIASVSIAPPQQKGATVKVEIGPNVRVSRHVFPNVEPYIAANPKNPNNLIVSASEVIDGKGIFARAYYTTDGGNTWLATTLPLESNLQANAYTTGIDSWVTYAESGMAFYSTLADIRLKAYGPSTLLVYRSENGGQSWKGPAIVPSRSFDAPHIVAATEGDKVRLYVSVLVIGTDRLVMPDPIQTTGVAIFRSDDGGVSFTKTAFIAHDQLSHNALNPLILVDGSLLVPFNEYVLNPSQRLTSSRFFVVRSQDGGQTFSIPDFVAEIPRTFPHRPRFAVDLSKSRFRGRVYAAWNGGREEERNVSIAYSADGGKWWSAPVTLRAENAGPGYYTTVAVSPDGTIALAWIQHEKTNVQCYRAYFAASIDGGQTFTRPYAVSDSISCPDNKENGETKFPPSNQSVFGRWRRGGDYMGLAASADGSFHAVWPDSRDGAFQIYTARIQVRK